MSGLEIYGIGAAQNPDNVGETIIIDGIDTSKLMGIKDEHDDESMWRRVGAITYHKKIMSAKDCENPQQARCWRVTQVPFLYIEGILADDTDHPNAKAAAEIIKFSYKSGVPLEVGFSIDGGIMERQNAYGMPTEDKEAGKTLAKTVGLDISLTVKPCNPKCKMFLKKDLTKSISEMPPPVNYQKLLQKSISKSSFRDIISTEYKVLLKLQGLKKSLQDYQSAFTDMKCKRCHSPVRFFKSTADVPHKCSSCESSYDLLQIWKALNN